MNKFAFTLVALCLAATSSAFADWKEKTLDEVIVFNERMLEKMASAENISSVSLLLFRYGLVSSISGMCIGFAGEAKSPMPEKTIAMGQKLLGKALRGETPSGVDVRQYGIECLTYIEDDLVTQGATREEIEKNLAPLFKQQLNQVGKEIF